jgi:hypothetical protein
MAESPARATKGEKKQETTQKETKVAWAQSTGHGVHTKQAQK